MATVTIYTRAYCPFCERALTLLAHKGATVKQIDAGADRDKKQEMIARSNGRTTFPQIFIGETHVGGCDDLVALDAAGRLDALLAET